MEWCELTILAGASSLSDVSNVIYSTKNEESCLELLQNCKCLNIYYPHWCYWGLFPAPRPPPLPRWAAQSWPWTVLQWVLQYCSSLSWLAQLRVAWRLLWPLFLPHYFGGNLANGYEYQYSDLLFRPSAFAFPWASQLLEIWWFTSLWNWRDSWCMCVFVCKKYCPMERF